MSKKVPSFKTDEEAEEFVATADLSEYDLSDMTPVHFELRKKDRSVSLRLPETLYEAVKQRAEDARLKETLNHLSKDDLRKFDRMLEKAIQSR